MTTGADLFILERASLTLLEVSQSLRAQDGPLQDACDDLRRGAPSSSADQAVDAVVQVLRPLLRELRDTAQVLSDEAARQRARFALADGA